MTRSSVYVGLFLVVLTSLALLAGPTGSTEVLQAAAVPIARLTTDPATDVRPAWSPNGDRIAFQSNRGGGPFHIWVMDPSGENQRAVTAGSTDDRHPFWSPDGNQIAFASGNAVSREIWIVNADGTNRRQVTTLGADSHFPAFSPDGRQLTFYVHREGVLSLWVVGVDGSNPRPLVPTLADQKKNQCTFACHQALWSPDGQRIAYTGGNSRSVWMIDANGGAPVQIAKSQADQGNNQHFPWWLSDGRLAYTVEHINTTEAWTDIWAVTVPDGAPTILESRIAHQGPLEWSPDNNIALFHSPRGGNFDIYSVDLRVDGALQILQGTPEAMAAPHMLPTRAPSAPSRNDAPQPTPAAPAAQAIPAAPAVPAAQAPQPTAAVAASPLAIFGNPIVLFLIAAMSLLAGAGTLALLAVGLGRRRR